MRLDDIDYLPLDLSDPMTAAFTDFLVGNAVDPPPWVPEKGSVFEYLIPIKRRLIILNDGGTGRQICMGCIEQRMRDGLYIQFHKEEYPDCYACWQERGGNPYVRPSEVDNA